MGKRVLDRAVAHLEVLVAVGVRFGAVEGVEEPFFAARVGTGEVSVEVFGEDVLVGELGRGVGVDDVVVVVKACGLGVF